MERETIEKDELVTLLEGLMKRPQRTHGLWGAGLAVARRSVSAPDPGRPGPLS